MAGGWSSAGFDAKSGEIARGVLFLLAGVLIFSIAVAQSAAILLIVLMLVRLISPQERRFRRTPLDLPLAFFVGIRCLSIVTSVDPGRSAVSLHTEIIFYALIPAVTHTLGSDSNRAITTIIRIAVAAGVAAASVGIFGVAMGWEGRAASTTGGYYTLGIYLTAVLPLLLVLGGTNVLLRQKGLWAAALIVIGAGIVATLNRLHWLAAGLFCVIAGLFRERRILYVALALGVIALFVVPDVADRFRQALNPAGNMSGRDVLWRGAAMIAGERPILGFGPRTFPVIFPLFDESPDKNVGSWHNDYLQIYMESGILGVAALLWLLWRGVVPAIQRMRSPGISAEERRVLLALSSSIGFFVIFGGMFDTLVGLFFKILLGATAVLAAAPGTGGEARASLQEGG